MIDEILNVLSHAEDEGSSSSQENTPQHTRCAYLTYLLIIPSLHVAFPFPLLCCFSSLFILFLSSRLIFSLSFSNLYSFFNFSSPFPSIWYLFLFHFLYLHLVYLLSSIYHSQFLSSSSSFLTYNVFFIHFFLSFFSNCIVTQCNDMM